MQLSGIFLGLGGQTFTQLLRGISIGKLKTFQFYDRMKARLHLPKLNSENIRKASPRLWTRLSEGDEDFATDLAQSILISHLDMIKAVLDFTGIPHEDGFFAKDVDAKPFLTEGWQDRVFEKFRGSYPEPPLLFYINHLGLELGKAETPFIPAAA